jgi:predicted DNA binding protein
VISARIYAEHPDLALSHTIRSLPDVEIGVVSDAGTDPQHDVYFFWFEAEDFDAVEAALEEDHTVADYSVIVEREGRRTYRIEYSDRAKLLTPAMTEIGGLTLESRSHSNGWVLRMHLTDHDGLYALSEYAAEEGIRLEILSLKQTEETYDRFDFGLTDEQREALVAAFVHGYYDEPRRTSLEGLASLLDISPTAVSGRLRRASARLVEEVLLDDEREDRT